MDKYSVVLVDLFTFLVHCGHTMELTRAKAPADGGTKLPAGSERSSITLVDAFDKLPEARKAHTLILKRSLPDVVALSLYADELAVLYNELVETSNKELSSLGIT
jgi:hypothetical protein